jgi:hypothetical protein
MTVTLEHRLLWSYASEKLGDAVRILTLHPATLRGRLCACTQLLAMVPANALPPLLARRYADIWAVLIRRVDAEGTPSVVLSLRGLRETTLVRLAEEICRLNAETEKLAEGADAGESRHRVRGSTRKNERPKLQR